MRAALHVRVSTADQKPELQFEELRAYAAHRRRGGVEKHQDVISGAKVPVLITLNVSTPGPMTRPVKVVLTRRHPMPHYHPQWSFPQSGIGELL